MQKFASVLDIVLSILPTIVWFDTIINVEAFSLKELHAQIYGITKDIGTSV